MNLKKIDSKYLFYTGAILAVVLIFTKKNIDTANLQMEIILKNNINYYSFLDPMNGKLYLENNKRSLFFCLSF